MSFDSFVDLVLLNVNGGQLPSDAAVLRPEVEEYAPVILGGIFDEWVKEQQIIAARLKKTLSLGSANYQTVVLAKPTQRDQNGDWYVDLPGFIYVVNGRAAILKVSAGPTEFIMMAPGNMLDMIPSFFAMNTTTTTRLVFTDKPQCDVTVVCMMKPAYGCNNIEIPMPDTVVYRAVDKATDHFRRQALTPSDVILDNSGVNDVTKK